MEEQVISMDAINLGYVLFGECLERWNISYERLSVLIKDFKLLSYINDVKDYLNELSNRACVKELEKHIKECGGSINAEDEK